MGNKESLSQSFERELKEAETSTILDPAYRKKKIFLWLIRTTLSVIIYIVYWKHDLVKWSLILVIPLSLFSLFSIIGSPYLLKRKIERTNKKIEETEKLISETADE